MDVQAAILAAVADRPADDTPRLAYADWLDDHAADLPDPAAARGRAEFIRVQCEVERLRHRPNAVQQGFATLYRRQDALLAELRADLLGPLADVLGPYDAAFERGFLAELKLDAPAFAAHADWLAALLPPPDVTLSGVALHLDALGGVSHHLERVTTAAMQTPRWPENVALSPDDVGRVFADAWPWGRLRELSLEGCGIGDAGVMRFVAGGAVPNLVHLDLSLNDIGDVGVAELVASPLWPRLRSLVLGGNPIGDDGAFALADAPPTGLEYLNLKYTAITRRGQQRLLPRAGWKVDLF